MADYGNEQSRCGWHYYAGSWPSSYHAALGATVSLQLTGLAWRFCHYYWYSAWQLLPIHEEDADLSALPAIIVMTFLAMGTNMSLIPLIMAGPGGILLGYLSVCGGLSTTLLIANPRNWNCWLLFLLLQVNALTPAAMAEANPVALFLQQQTHRQLQLSLLQSRHH